MLKVQIGKFKTDNIVKNEERVMGVNRYDILMGTFTEDWTPIFRKFCKINRACAPSENVDKGKFKVFLNFDEFTKAWNVVAWDFADINQDFTTQNVDKQVRLLN